MSEAAKEVKSTDLSLTGLEEVFDADSTVIEGFHEPDTTVSEGLHQAAINVNTAGLTIKEASQHYKLAIPTIRLKIKTGEIPAIKVDGPKGPEWRVFPDGIPDHGHTTDYPDTTVVEGSYEADITLSEGLHQANINVASLIKANQELIAKLESATYRNGYLEAQIESERQQVKLLTDQLHKPSLGFWARFGAWFMGSQK